MPPLAVLYSPFPDVESARKAARELVSRKLVACANIVPEIRSVYEWEGKICEEREAALWAKTLPEAAEEAQERLRQLHPYACPCVMAFPAEANADYLAWMRGTLAGEAPREEGIPPS
jgi:periplasmic divalent cation tolerance protein